VSTSLEKVEALSAELLRADEQFDGLLGLVQMAVAMEKSGLALPGVGQINITDGLPEDPAELDEQLLGVAGFVLWLRSDDAPLIDTIDLMQKMPAEIAELVRETGMLA